MRACTREILPICAQILGMIEREILPFYMRTKHRIISWEPKGTPNATPPRSKALLRDYQPLVSLNK